MSGLIRNLITLFQAWLAQGTYTPQSRVDCHFRVTPLDCGTHVLKSDKVLQLAESAQLDFLVKTRLLGTLRRGGIGFVNASQLIKFMKPIRMFARVRVETAVVHADDKCAWFSHALWVGNVEHAQVLVKMKFKQGARTVPPRDVLGAAPEGKPVYLRLWDEMLGAWR